MKNMQKRAPSVIIGVGGIGSDICASVERMMPKNAPDQDQVRFVVMDTDINAIRDLQRKGFRGTAITLTDNMTVGTCRKLMQKYIGDWYPINEVFDRKSMTEGAGQQRAISRLALEYAALEGKLSPLYSVIQELEEVDPNNNDEQPKTFYIISSLAGGTGSGIALPLAMYINDYVGSKHFQEFSGCKGFFMLSSALEESVDSSLEQQSLDANAYAALKELSSFMSIADGDNERYNHLKLRLVGRSRQSDQSVQPPSYEYCFLFGLRNKKGIKVHSSADLKDIIANAVYMQACSPIHSRNNSREDNKLRHNTMLMNQQGERHLRRFGAIGCGELCYPKELLKEYYAMFWAKEVMQEQWRKYDLIYQNKEREELEKKQRGLKWTHIDRGAEYISSILTADDQDMLAEEIKDACRSPEGNIWDAYLDAMWDEIERRIDTERDSRIHDNSSDESVLRRYLGSATKKSIARKVLINTTNSVIEWHKKVADRTLDLAAQYKSALGSTWFMPRSSLDGLPKYYMEYWLTRDGQFMHPNAVRYFLYQLKAAIELRRQKAQEGRKEAESHFANEKSVKRFSNYCISKKKMRSSCRMHQQSWDAHYDYVKADAFDQVLEKCGIYVNKLILEYEKFYDSYQQLLQEFDMSIAMLEEELDRKSGSCRVYVCADRQCRERVAEEMKQQREFVRVDGPLSHHLFQRMGSGRWDQMDIQQKFESIKSYWSNGLEQNFPKLLSPHILHAIDMEEYYRYGHHMDEAGIKARIIQVKENVTLPFLQFRRLGSTKQGISICCYNSTLNQTQSAAFQGIIRWLKSEESVDDEYYCSPHRMVFYYSFFGLDVPELLEYMHGQSNVFYAMGPAFYSYEEMVENMGRSKTGHIKITPHTDKAWHNLQHMPDPQIDYQQNKEYRIAEALLYGFLIGRNSARKNGGHSYELRIEDTSFPAKRLIDCHNILYENQFFVTELLHKMRGEIYAWERDGVSAKEHWEKPQEAEKNHVVKNLWDMIFRYEKELTPRERSGYWMDFLLNGYCYFALDHVSGPKAAEEAKKLLQNQFDRFSESAAPDLLKSPLWEYVKNFINRL